VSAGTRSGDEVTRRRRTTVTGRSGENPRKGERHTHNNRRRGSRTGRGTLETDGFRVGSQSDKPRSRDSRGDGGCTLPPYRVGPSGRRLPHHPREDSAGHAPPDAGDCPQAGTGPRTLGSELPAGRAAAPASHSAGSYLPPKKTLRTCQEDAWAGKQEAPTLSTLLSSGLLPGASRAPVFTLSYQGQHRLSGGHLEYDDRATDRQDEARTPHREDTNNVAPTVERRGMADTTFLALS
jgi:hypothetical protein